MAITQSKLDLEAEIADLKEENEELQNQVDTIADFVALEDEDDDEDEDADNDEDGDADDDEEEEGDQD